MKTLLLAFFALSSIAHAGNRSAKVTVIYPDHEKKEYIFGINGGKGQTIKTPAGTLCMLELTPEKDDDSKIDHGTMFCADPSGNHLFIVSTAVFCGDLAMLKVLYHRNPNAKLVEGSEISLIAECN